LEIGFCGFAQRFTAGSVGRAIEENAKGEYGKDKSHVAKVEIFCQGALRAEGPEREVDCLEVGTVKEINVATTSVVIQGGGSDLLVVTLKKAFDITVR
jgi:hypothetical protein